MSLNVKDLVQNAFKKYQVRYENGTKWNLNSKQVGRVEYCVFQRQCGTNSNQNIACQRL